MSVAKLETAVSALPKKARGLAHVENLRAAAGKKVKEEERSFLLDHYQKESSRYRPEAKSALAQLAGVSAHASPATSFNLEARHFTKITEQSALTYVAALDGFFAVDDESAAVHFIRRKSMGQKGSTPSVALELPGVKLDDLEGIAFDADKSRLLVLSEGKHAVFAVPLEVKNGKPRLGPAEKLGKLPKVGADKAKGYEGLAYLPASLAPDQRAHLLVVHEGSPKLLGLFDPDTLEKRAVLELPKSLEGKLKDLSDVSVDPLTGHIALLSDESSRVVFVELKSTATKGGKAHEVQNTKKKPGFFISPVSTLDLPKMDPAHKQKKAVRLQPEGLSFDQKGDLWVSAEGDLSMMRFSRNS